ncbi:WXG100 family type VII secretion target [Streptomyces sp. NRRL F-2580]|uniref:WXG100 family type VII secretion target n=1 Tax=Streptomyces sp. NRRL F-2580 TaxID=1463841 RepID=UPI000A7B2D8B|nr:WXG100 family type VII secretion target [Streptomyces sp. NRRL F-2580]
MSQFEGYSHAQLYAMIAALDPEAAERRARQLSDAAKVIEDIGAKLKDHKVKGWEGVAADAFQNWVNQTGSATLTLAKYSATGGKNLLETAQVMRLIKPVGGGEGEMPKYDAAAESKLTQNLMAARENAGNEAAVKLGQEAWSKLNGDHGQAVTAMVKLSDSYDQTSSQMERATIPTFPPPPNVLVPDGYYGTSNEVGRAGSESGGGGGSTGPSYTTTGSSHSTSSSDPGSVTGRPPQPDNTVPSVSVPSVPDREVDVDLDSVAVLPDRTVPPVTTLPGPLPTGPVSPTPGPVLPPMGFPPVGGMKPPRLTGPGIGPYPTLGGPGTPPPGGKAVGMPPRDSGITGGRPVTSTGPSSGIPRGNVIGEGTHAGRGMGGGMGPGGGGGHGGQNGFAAGRRLASEPGGIVGGKPGTAARPIAGGQPFTQGGSGLVRNGVGGVGPGAMGHAGARTQTPGKRQDDQQGERADYLVEDEETWQGNRRVVPPVID